MDNHNKSTKLESLKQRLMEFESNRTPVSPSTMSPRLPKEDEISPPYNSTRKDLNIHCGGGETGGGGGSGRNHHLDVSGLAPLEDTVCETNVVHQQQQQSSRASSHNFHLPPPPSMRHVSPTENNNISTRMRHSSDRNMSSSTSSLATTEAQNNEFGGGVRNDGVHFEEANYNCGLTLPTSATKKKAGMRSYLSTPDTRSLVGDVGGGVTGGAPPSVTSADETGPRKRSLGKARRVLKTADSTSPKDNAEDKTNNDVKTSACPSEVAKTQDQPPPFSLGTINESEDGLLHDANNDDLLISDLRLSEDLDGGLNDSFSEGSMADDLPLNDENQDTIAPVEAPLKPSLTTTTASTYLNGGSVHSSSSLHHKWSPENFEEEAEIVKRRQRRAGLEGQSHGGKTPLRELRGFGNHDKEADDEMKDFHNGGGVAEQPKPQKSGKLCNNGNNNPVATLFPHTPMQQKGVKHSQQHNQHSYQQQHSQPNQQQLHPGLKTPLNSMRPPSHQMPLFTPAQPFHHQQQQQPYASSRGGKKQKFVDVNGVPYQLIRQIGSGGSCKVYQAADFEKQRLVAIKIVDLDEVDQTMIDSYKNEITILQKLQHSNRVVQLIDHELSRRDNLLYIVMECGDCDLATIFNERVARKNITRNLVRFYWEEMLSCIAVIHAEGIVHSDLKPANFLLVNGTLKLIDFGIANAIQSDKTSITRDSQIGTLNYMSPEAILDTQPPNEDGDDGDEEGKPRIKIGTRSDVWSLGCILYSMVYAKTPFHHLTNHLSKIQAIINPRFQIKFADVSNTNLMEVMKKCLNREPKSRPSVDELLAHPYLRN